MYYMGKDPLTPDRRPLVDARRVFRCNGAHHRAEGPVNPTPTESLHHDAKMQMWQKRERR